MKIALSKIRLDGGTQIRIGINEDHVADLVESTNPFPPIVIFHDGTDHWLADGFHRVMAATRLGWPEIDADVKTGTLSDAIDFACAANSQHGLKRSNEDKRNAVQTMLLRRPDWSDRKIAEHCGVSHTFVAKIRTPAESKAPKASGNVATPAAEKPEKPAKQLASDASPASAPAPAASSGPPKITYDKAGRPVVDSKLAKVMADAAWFDETVKKLQEIRRDIVEMGGGELGWQLRVNTIETDLRNAIEAVKWARPHTTCPYSGCKSRGCKACGGHRWVTESVWDNIPADIKGAKK